MGTINYTKINFTLLELLHLIGRVELMNDIMHIKLADADVFFPRNPFNHVKENQFDLPSDYEIDETISRALAVAIDDAIKFGINVSPADIQNCPIDHIPSVVNNVEQNSDDEFVDLGIACDDKLIEYGNLKDYHSDLNKSPDENSRFVNVASSSGTKTVRKSSLMWFRKSSLCVSLSGYKEKLSSDRLNRVRGQKRPRRQLEFVDLSVLNEPIHK